ncbi:MAG: class I SAM-dependent methyltransferase [Planctomycetes bacterium]|nr:class I SAM-dependent methyltransferase [Planctomycetota bacterium]
MTPQSTTPPDTVHAAQMERRYRWQAATFDLTRRPLLLGRSGLAECVRGARAVLEVGCGTGQNLARLRAAAPEARIVGVECARSMARRARRRAVPRVEVMQADYGAAALPLGAFDRIVFSYSLSMIPHFADALRRASSDLVPGGSLVVLDFVAAPPPIAALLRLGGVELGGARWEWLAGHLAIQDSRERVAWGGLWRYRLVVAEKRGESARRMNGV